MEHGHNGHNVGDSQPLINGDTADGEVDQHCDIDDSTANHHRVKWWERCKGPANRLITVEPALICIIIAYGIVINLRGQYIRQEIAKEYGIYGPPGSSQSSCNGTNNGTDNKIQAESSDWGIYLSVIGSVPSFLSVTIFGAWSDRMGRTSVMLLPIVGMVLTTLLSTLIVSLGLHIGFFLLASFIEGATGGLLLIMSLSFSYIADITTKERRMFRIVITEMIFYIGAGVSQIGIGYLLQAIGYPVPMVIAEGFCVLTFFYVLLIVPETVRRHSDNAGSAVEIPRKKKAKVFQTMKALFKIKTNYRRQKLVISLSALFSNALTSNLISLVVLYGLGQPFCWDSILIGYFIAIDLVAVGIGSIVGAKLLPYCLSDIVIIYVALIDSILMVAVVATSRRTAQIFIACFVGFLRGLNIPVLKSMVSKMVSVKEQGAAFACMGSIQGLGSFLSPIIFNGLYSATVWFFPPFVFYLTCGVLVIPLFLMCLLHVFIRMSANADPSGLTIQVDGEETISNNNIN